MKTETNPFRQSLTQLSLFDLGDASVGALELIPAVWNAAEALAHPDAKVRTSGLDYLIIQNAARFSPLVAYMIATRLNDPSLDIRGKVVGEIARTIRKDELGHLAPDAVRLCLLTYLSQFRTRQIYGLLQVAVIDHKMKEQVEILLNANSYAGKHLMDILADRKAPFLIRQIAAEFIGRTGNLDVIPLLERMVMRLEAKINGQQSMPFGLSEESDEIRLLPVIQVALLMLNAP